jgi:large subunit ribosomal protein L3
MKLILGTKVAMSQIFDADGVVHPVTVISAGPVTVTQLKTNESDGYQAVQVGFGDRNEKNISKAVKGHLKGLGNFRFLREFPLVKATEMKIGDKIDVSAFQEGDVVQVSGVSKGKGFQGVVKRHGFHGGPRSHGQKHSEREAGSIGGGLRTGPRKGMRMAGRMGGDRVTVKNLKVVQIDSAKNEIFISGAIPGRRGTLVEITSIK